MNKQFTVVLVYDDLQSYTTWVQADSVEKAIERAIIDCAQDNGVDEIEVTPAAVIRGKHGNIL